MRTYYRLTKPGIVYGNGLSAVAGFLLASSLQKHFYVNKFIALLIGMSLVIACGCVVNNIIDRQIDARMARTSKRALVVHEIPITFAIIYGMVLGVVGFYTLVFFTNTTTSLLGVLGLFFYLVLYSIFKRRSPSGTVVGSLSGATPIAAGYTAVTGRFDGAAAILFITMVCWQMPHFYAIAIYRHRDYKAAGLPVLPVQRGIRLTKYYVLAYVTAFMLAAGALTAFGYAGSVYLVVILLLGGYWFHRGVKGLKVKNDIVWGKQMFGLSLVVLIAFSFMVSIGALLP